MTDPSLLLDDYNFFHWRILSGSWFALLSIHIKP